MATTGQSIRVLTWKLYVRMSVCVCVCVCVFAFLIARQAADERHRAAQAKAKTHGATAIQAVWRAFQVQRFVKHQQTLKRMQQASAAAAAKDSQHEHEEVGVDSSERPAGPRPTVQATMPAAAATSSSARDAMLADAAPTEDQTQLSFAEVCVSQKACDCASKWFIEEFVSPSECVRLCRFRG